jgi:hypothetical protein
VTLHSGTDLDAVATELAAARAEVVRAATACTVYVDRLAATGDPTARALAAHVHRAYDRLTASNVLGATAIEENR